MSLAAFIDGLIRRQLGKDRDLASVKSHAVLHSGLELVLVVVALSSAALLMCQVLGASQLGAVPLILDFLVKFEVAVKIGHGHSRAAPTGATLILTHYASLVDG